MTKDLSLASDAPFALVEIDASSPSRPLSPPASLALSWHDLSVRDGVAPKTSKKSKTTTPTTPPVADATSTPSLVIDAVSGDAQPGELLAIVAPSRRVTTALLRALVGRSCHAATTTGTVRVNGAAVRMTPTMVGFVPHDDLLFATLPVETHLRLQAALRLGDETTHDDQHARVAHVLRETNLSDVVSSLIGDGSDHTANGLSRRDRKLLSLATELLTNPSILLLDKPLDGLDAFAADDVVRCLHTLARNGHTVVMTATLDQPTSAMFGLVDKLHLLSAHGRTVFHGPPLESLAFFQTHGFVCPALTNPFEFVAHQLVVRNDDDNGAARVHLLEDAWASTATQHDHVLTETVPVLEPFRDGPGSLHRAHNSVTTQLQWLLRRNILRIAHDVPTVRGRFIQSLVIAVVLGLIFLRLDVSQTTFQTFGSACFFITAIQFITNAVPEFLHVPKEVAIVLRDHGDRHYHALSWYVVKNLSELLFQVVYPLVFLTPVYFLIGFPTDTEVFFSFYLFAFLVASTGVAIGLFASCVAPKPKLAIVLSIALIAPSMIFGGPFLNRKTTPDYFLWLQQISPVKYCYHGLLRAFWGHVDSIDCAPGAMCRVTSGQAVLAMNFVKPDTFTSDWQLLLVINVALRVLGGIVLWRRAAAHQ